MQEARATHFRRGWLVPCGVLLLVFALWILLFRGQRQTGAARNTAQQDLAPSSADPQSAAEDARKRFIAGLGPIERRQGTNGADLYRQAFGLYGQLTDEEKKAIENKLHDLDPKSAAALYQKIQPIMDLIRRARAANYTDWGLEPIRKGGWWGQDLLAVPPVQTLADLALWDSTYRFQSDPDGAVSDLAAMDAMARGGLNNEEWFEQDVQIHESALKLLAQNMTGISSAAGSDLADILSTADIEQNLQGAMKGDVSLVQLYLDEYADPAARTGSLIQMIATDKSINPGEFISELEWWAQTAPASASATMLLEPDAQYQQWRAQKLAEAASIFTGSTHQDAGDALDSFADSRNQARTMLVENAMIEAALALEQDDEESFEAITDPATGQPFIYTQTADGFQLGSALKQNGKPVTLSFSMPTAK